MKKAKILGLAGALVLVSAGAWALKQPAKAPGLPVLGELKPFLLRDQAGGKFTEGSLQGSVTVVDFIFTTCPGICPMLTQQMQTLEKNTRESGNKIRFVSITVDPDTDSTPVLRDYAKAHGINLARWKLVTGAEPDVKDVVVGGFGSAMGIKRVPASDNGPDSIEVAHSENFFVLDPKGRIRFFHTARSEEDLQALYHSIELLLSEKD